MSDKSKTIEEKMNELRGAAAWFDGDTFTLGEATEKFKDATKLAGEIEHDLKELENQIIVLKQSFDEAA